MMGHKMKEHYSNNKKEKPVADIINSNHKKILIGNEDLRCRTGRSYLIMPESQDFKKDGNLIIRDARFKDYRKKIQRLDPRMAQYMGRMYVEKDKGKGSNESDVEDIKSDETGFTKYKFTEYKHNKISKRKSINGPEDDVFCAAMGLLKLAADLKVIEKMRCGKFKR